MAEAEDEVLAGARPPRRRSVLVVGAGVAALVAVAVGAGFAARHHPGSHRAPAAALSTPLALPSGTPAPAATDALVIGNSTGLVSGSQGTTYSADIRNGTRQPLDLAGPIQVLGPDGSPLAGVTAVIVSRAGNELAISRTVKPTSEIGAGKAAELEVRFPAGCRAARGLPTGYPRIVISLRGYAKPANYPFTYFWQPTGPPDGCVFRR